MKYCVLNVLTEMLSLKLAGSCECLVQQYLHSYDSVARDSNLRTFLESFGEEEVTM